MQHAEIATRAGLHLGDLESLWRGKVTASVASRLGLSMADIEDFIKGSASAAITRRLGFRAMTAAEELARVGGKEGAVGIIVGLLLGMP
jgi:hypothetical protein